MDRTVGNHTGGVPPGNTRLLYPYDNTALKSVYLALQFQNQMQQNRLELPLSDAYNNAPGINPGFQQSYEQQKYVDDPTRNTQYLQQISPSLETMILQMQMGNHHTGLTPPQILSPYNQNQMVPLDPQPLLDMKSLQSQQFSPVVLPSINSPVGRSVDTSLLAIEKVTPPTSPAISSNFTSRTQPTLNPAVNTRSFQPPSPLRSGYSASRTTLKRAHPCEEENRAAKRYNGVLEPQVCKEAPLETVTVLAHTDTYDQNRYCATACHPSVERGAEIVLNGDGAPESPEPLSILQERTKEKPPQFPEEHLLKADPNRTRWATSSVDDELCREFEKYSRVPNVSVVRAYAVSSQLRCNTVVAEEPLEGSEAPKKVANTPVMTSLSIPRPVFDMLLGRVLHALL